MVRTARYDREVAEAYAALMGDGVGDPATSALLELLGSVGDMRVLDVPCGEGRVARELARRSSAVVGVDLSAAMLERARALENDEPLGIVYVEADGTAPDALAGEVFDAVVCNFGLSDIDDLDAVLATFARVLAPGGAFVFSILHPCFPGWGTALPGDWPPGGYYREEWWAATQGPATDPRFTVGTNHRMISTHLNAFLRHDFVIEELAEPEPGPEWSMPDSDPVPMYLAGRCRRR